MTAILIIRKKLEGKSKGLLLETPVVLRESKSVLRIATKRSPGSRRPSPKVTQPAATEVHAVEVGAEDILTKFNIFYRWLILDVLSVSLMTKIDRKLKFHLKSRLSLLSNFQRVLRLQALRWTVGHFQILCCSHNYNCCSSFNSYD